MHLHVRFPARVFVGDTFCYFAGQVLACAGVLGHFSKTLLLFFVPQLFNFALSLPQLAALTPCPRHRVPNIDLQTMALHPSMAHYGDKRPRPLAVLILRIFSALRLAHLVWVEDQAASIADRDPDTARPRRRLASTSNLTLLNAILVFRGVKPLPQALAPTPTQAGQTGKAEGDPATMAHQGPRISERSLWWHVILLQIACSMLAFGIRYWLAAVVFP